MSLFAQSLGVIALVPAMVGPQAEQAGASLVMQLCNGGTLLVSLDGERAPGPALTPCCAKGCRSRERRQRIDPEQ